MSYCTVFELGLGCVLLGVLCTTNNTTDVGSAAGIGICLLVSRFTCLLNDLLVQSKEAKLVVV